MNYLRQLLSDRRRRQRGSVLSSVLIMVAFLSIISGALMTELSTNFMISRALVNRVANEATVNSAMELAFNQLQITTLESGCPTLNPVSENSRSAVASYAAQCVQRRVTAGLPSWSSFNVDGTRVQLAGRDEYLVGDTRGLVYEYNWGSYTPKPLLALGGNVSGRLQAMVDPSDPTNAIDLVPVHRPTKSANPGCGPERECVAVLSETPQLNLRCFMAANGPVTAQPAAGKNFPSLVFFGDSSGNLSAYRPVDLNGSGDGEGNGNDCVLIDRMLVPGGQAIVAGPVVVPCVGCGHPTDEIYVVASDGGSSKLVHFTYTPWAGGLHYVDPVLPLPGANPSGIALDPNNPRFAISFLGGQVALARINADYTMSVSATSVPTTIAGAPFWCACGPDVIAVGGGNGGLYLLGAGLNSIGTYMSSGPAIRTTPGTDKAGNWFFGADDGYVYEVPQATMTLSKKYGSLGGQIGSSTVVGSCYTGSTVCIYLGLRNASPSIVPFDSRQAVFTACISTAPPTCSGDNPRLWARVEVGSAVSAQTVRVTGWSYYSP